MIFVGYVGKTVMIFFFLDSGLILHEVFKILLI